MASTRHILIFGDLTVAFEEDLKAILQQKHDATLRDFFGRVTFAFRHEFTSLSQARQEWFPRFTTLQDLLENNRGLLGAPALRFALLCVYEIGKFIRVLGSTKMSFPSAKDSYILGLCTGSFPAAAVAVSRNVQDLVDHGVEAVILAFRTASHSLEIQQDLIAANPDGPHSWSTIVSLSEDMATKAIDEFCSTQIARPKLSQPYISAVGLHNVTISGPPLALVEFTKSKQLKQHVISIESPYHAPHIFTNEDVDKLLDSCTNSILESSVQRIPILSPVTGTLDQGGTFKEALRRAVQTSLCEQIRWDKITAGCVQAVTRDEAIEHCAITPIASSATTILSSALSSNTRLKVTVSNPLGLDSDQTAAFKSTGRFEDSKIAIVGFSGRYPEADSNEKFWQLLMEGRDTHRTIPSDRFDWEAHYDPTGKRQNTSKVKHGCFINEPGLFDARFFHLSPKEAEDADPAQRLVLMATFEALEMAGFVPDRTPSSQRDRVGVFFGVTSDDWREVNSGQNVGTYFIPGGNRAFVPGRISYFFRFSGPSVSVDTACSSSFAAINIACLNLWQGNCDTAITGGTNVLTNPDNFAGLDRGHFLSTTGNCNPFDNDADGYCRADGVGSVILKRLEDAIADEDPVFGVINGVHTNHCGQTVSITRPHEGDQLSLFKRMMRHSGVNPVDVSYVEMHGTGTQAGDAAEMKSVLTAFEKGYGRTSKQPLHLGAVKANVGHSESASGVSALIKVLMMMQHDTIPPHVGIKKEINHHYPLDLKERHVKICLEATTWRKDQSRGGKRISFLNNFSAAGGNTAVLLEDGPTSLPNKSVEDIRSVHPVTVSARSLRSLKENLMALIAFLEAQHGTSLPALSYTTTARRVHHQFRTVVNGSDIGGIKSALARKIDDADKTSAVPSSKNLPKVVFTFTGQGALYAGMGRVFFTTIDSFRSDILRFDSIAQKQGFPSFLPLIESTADELAIETVDTVATHLALICLQMALSRLWISWGIVPSFVTGHSLGEYAALFTCGVLTASDTIYLGGTRARLLSERCTRGSHSMVSVKASRSSIEGIVARTTCDIACSNSPVDTVVSGPTSDVETIIAEFHAQGFESVKLNIPYAFHSAQVDVFLDDFESIARDVDFREPNIPYFSPFLAETVSSKGVLTSSYLARACRAPVNFYGAVEAAANAGDISGNTLWLELGPHPICSSFVKKIMGQAKTLPTLRQGTDAWKVTVAGLEMCYLNGFEIQWNEYHQPFASAHNLVPIPHYKWDLKNYWIPYRNNFCLTKGADTMPADREAAREPAPVSLSSSVHRIITFENGQDKSTLVIESDIQDPRLVPLLQGHLVNGVALTSSSIYADMVNTMAKYMLEGAGKRSNSVGIDCRDMKVLRPLVSLPSTPSQPIRVSGTADWSHQEIAFSIWSVNSNGRKIADHASCIVRITPNNDWMEEWRRNSYLVQDRITSLHRNVDTGNSHKLKRGLVYKLFAALVDYADRYQGMQEVVLDSEMLEATSRVTFQCGDEGFQQNPCWIDSLGSIAGFIMNGNDNVTSKHTVFINHGWTSMRCAKSFEFGKTYQAYNRMQLQSGTMYAGNTYVLEDNVVIAVFEGVKFQGVPRTVLDNLLPAKTQTPRRSPQNPPQVTSQRESTNLQAFKSTPSSETNTPTDSDSDNRGDETDATSVDDDIADESSNGKIMATIRVTVAEEAGAPLEDVTPTTHLSELGIDSLLSLTIMGRLKELGLDLPPNLLTEYDSLLEIENSLFPPAPKVHKQSEKASEPQPSVSDPPFATSIFLSRPPQHSAVTQTLFLFPDGAGSSTSYASLPSFPSTTVYGLNCPWLRKPQDMKCSLEHYVSKFLKEVRKRQPSGPYCFGGWSAGGILAYEAAQQLSREGEEVTKLLLLDSPDPVGLENPPQRLYDFLESLDMFGSQGKDPPSWLRPHFDAFLKMLDGYEVQSFQGKPPQTYIFYARDGLCKNPDDPRPEMRDDDPREMHWLINNRTNFSGGGWRDLLGAGNISVSVLDNVNHYTIIESSRGLGDAIDRVLKIR